MSRVRPTHRRRYRLPNGTWDALQCRDLDAGKPEQIKTMIPLTELEQVAKARLTDALLLAMYDRYDGAGYLCGYAVEIAFKVRICKDNGLSSFPENNAEFNQTQLSFQQGGISYPLTKLKTHELVKLANFCDFWNTLLQQTTDGNYSYSFSLISVWNSELRYHRIGGISLKKACQMIESAEHLLSVLL